MPKESIGPWDVGLTLQSFTRGVDIFFVLSGFCIFWPYATDRSRIEQFEIRSFMRRRVMRIVPAYYANIVFVTLLPVALVIVWRSIGKDASWQEPPSIFDFVTHFLFIHTFFESTWASIQGVYWTLALEMQFYLVFPLVVWMFRRVGIWTIAIMLISCIVYRMGVSWAFQGYTGDWVRPFLFRSTFIGCWVHFAAGMLAAILVAKRFRDGCSPLNSITALTLSIVSLGLLVLTTHTTLFARIPLFPADDFVVAFAVAIFVVSVAHARSPVVSLLTLKPVVFIGVISYSLYLVHQNVAWYISELLIKVFGLSDWNRFAAMMGIGMPMILALSYFFYRLFEKPFMRVSKTNISSPTTSPPSIKNALANQ